MASSNGITYRIGDATAPDTDGPAIIAHVCNDTRHWGKGFVLAVSARWKDPEREFRQWSSEVGDDLLPLGAVQLVQVEPDRWVANMVGQRGIRRSKTGEPPIRYAAVETALTEVARQADVLGASVHLPRIGCGLAGGTWSDIEPILERTLVAAGVGVVVYDLPARSSR